MSKNVSAIWQWSDLLIKLIKEFIVYNLQFIYSFIVLEQK